MKTIREWLEELPEPYRTQAIENAINADGFKSGSIIENSLSEAISAAFVWSKSPQGHEYWDDFHDSLED